MILTQNYLRDVVCMSELHRIWIEAREEGDAFREKVRVFLHPDAKIRTVKDRISHAKHWSEVLKSEEADMRFMGARDRSANVALNQFVASVRDILAEVADCLQPRSLEELLTHSFS